MAGVAGKKAPRLVSLGAHTTMIEPDSYFILRQYNTPTSVSCQTQELPRQASLVGAPNAATRQKRLPDMLLGAFW